VLIEITKELIFKHRKLEEKVYLSLVKEYFKRVKQRKAQEKELINNLKALTYSEISNFSLIGEKTFQVPIFVEYDKDAKDIVSMLSQLERISNKKYEERMLKRNLFKEIKPHIWAYVVNVPANLVVQLGFGSTQLPYLKSILYLSQNYYEFDRVYSKETGFIREVDHKSVFL
jgi:hypothetical protein